MGEERGRKEGREEKENRCQFKKREEIGTEDKRKGGKERRQKKKGKVRVGR